MCKFIHCLFLIVLAIPTICFSEDRYVQVATSSDGNVYYEDTQTTSVDSKQKSITMWLKTEVAVGSSDYRIFQELTQVISNRRVIPETGISQYTFMCKVKKFKVHQINIYSTYSLEASYTPDNLIVDPIPGSVMEGILTRKCASIK